MKLLLIILISAFFFTTSGLIFAETGETPEKNELPKSWLGEIQTGFISDNNIFQAKNNKDSDTIWESMIFMAYQPDRIKWSGRAIFDQYQKNEELSYSFFELGAEQSLGTRDYGMLFINFSPTAPLDKEEANTDPFALASYGFNASLDRDTDDFGNIGISLSYTRLDYDSPFDAKDIDIISFSPSLFYRINNFWVFYGEYSYEVGKADTGTIPGGFHDDISYKAHAFSLKMSHQLSKKASLRFRYRIRKKQFTTGNDDSLHVDRKDTNHALYGAHIYSPMKDVFLETRVDYLWKNSTDSFVEYNESRFTVTIGYQF